MTKILIVAATYNEIKFLEKLNLTRVENSNNTFHFQFKNHQIDLLITGVGMIATTFQLTKQLVLNKYDLVLNLGIAGAFEKSIQLGEVVQVSNDYFADLGAVDDDKFISAFELGLLDNNEFPFKNCLLKNDIRLSILNTYKKVNGITVNTVNGNEIEIEKLKNTLSEKNYKPETESMEGAAFFYTCFQFKTACIQLRSISNYIEKRNKANWKIKEALENLEKATIFFLNDLAIIAHENS